MLLCTLLEEEMRQNYEVQECIERDELATAIATYLTSPTSSRAPHGEMLLLPPNSLEIYNLPDPKHLLLQLKYAKTFSPHEMDRSSIPPLIIGYFYALACWHRTNDFFNYLRHLSQWEKDFLVLLSGAFSCALMDSKGFRFKVDKLPDHNEFFAKHLFSPPFYESPVYEKVFPLSHRKEIIAQCRHSLLSKKNERTLPLIVSRDILECTMQSGGFFSLFAPFATFPSPSPPLFPPPPAPPPPKEKEKEEKEETPSDNDRSLLYDPQDPHCNEPFPRQVPESLRRCAGPCVPLPAYSPY